MAFEGMKVEIRSIPGLSREDIIPDEGLLFQCPPLDEFAQDHAHSHTDYETINNQHSHKGVPQLSTVQFDTLVVDQGSFTIDPDPLTIEEYTDILKLICLAGDPFLLTAAHQLPPAGFVNWSLSLAGPELQMPATLRSLRIAERSGEPDARYLNVAFSEYRDPFVKTALLGRRPGGKKFPTTAYLYWDGHATDADGRLLTSVSKPLTLALLARYFYHDTAAARPIARANDISGWGVEDPLINYRTFRSMRIGTRMKIDIPKLHSELIAEKTGVESNVPGGGTTGVISGSQFVSS